MSAPRPRTDAQAWSHVVTKLQQYQSLLGRGGQNLKQVNVLQASLQNETEPLAMVRPKLERAYEVAKRDIDEENKCVTDALDTLSGLLATRSASQAAVAETSLDKRKKRRLDSPSAADSPAPAINPAQQVSAPMQRVTSKSASVNTPSPSLSKIPLPNAGNGSRRPSPAPNGGPKSAVPPLKKQGFQLQLPLLPGRPVAFKVPSEKDSPDEGTEWIMAKVVKSINNDRTRYEVQDVEGDDGNPGVIYATTLRSMVPLPDTRDRNTFPPEYPPGTEVMALYPETTSFYHAKIAQSPTQTKRPTYRVVFDEDDNNVTTVQVDQIALWPEAPQPATA